MEGWYDQIIGVENAGVINGPEYKMELLGRASHPFFGSGETKGMVRYNQETFTVPLLYDIYKDAIVVKHLGRSGRGWLIQLDKKMVVEFVIEDRLFRNFDRGFHEVIFEGNNFLLVSRRTKISEVTKGITNYITHDRYFIIDANNWKTFRNTKSFVKMLPKKEDQKQVKLFVKEHKIKVRKFRNEDLYKVASLVNTLRNNE
jgi:hypothetical protein